MKGILQRIFITNWPRKLVALIAALFLWFLVNQSITITRTISDVSVRIINLPQDKTVVGLLPNGLLNKRISVTITGAKSILEDLQPSDIEILINAEGRKESWIATINKKNLVNLNAEWDLKKSINDVSANDLFIKISKLVTEEIPVTICRPVGDPPKGYQFLDVWPNQLVQKISGPQEQVQALKERGIEVTFNLNLISKAELDAIQDLQTTKSDEVSYYVSDSWKQIPIPFRENTLEPLNDPRAKFLRIDFLKQEVIALDTELPVSVFYPVKFSRTLNPENYPLSTGRYIEKKNGLNILSAPLYTRDVSRLFLDVVRNNMELTIIASPKNVQKKLDWTVTFFNLDALEEIYVSSSLERTKEDELQPKYGEQYLRNRFRDYVRNFELYINDEIPLELRVQLGIGSINVHVENLP